MTIKPLEWCDAAAAFLAAAMPHKLNGTGALKRMLDAGDAVLFGVYRGFYLVACYVLRIDRHEFGADGVIVAASGRIPAGSLIASCMPTVESQFHGVDMIRIHTARPGLVRTLLKSGYTIRETVLEKEVKHGR